MRKDSIKKFQNKEAKGGGRKQNRWRDCIEGSRQSPKALEEKRTQEQSKAVDVWKKIGKKKLTISKKAEYIMNLQMSSQIIKYTQ